MLKIFRRIDGTVAQLIEVRLDRRPRFKPIVGFQKSPREFPIRHVSLP